ncbi:MAG TPA: sugar ABC transporter ATP-binding protein [Candidatus Limnocylindria bacterium]|nr:sugar ABC transporter ATP-binding protein [Candidatus Limnocylindria bacterium]
MSYLLEVRSVSKRFPGVLALENISLTLARGEVLAVVGENGAGKSTLMKILAGVQEPDAGEILIDDRVVEISSVRVAQRLGIALIHQELNLADNLSVAANIFLGREPRSGWFIRTGETETSSTSVLRQVGLDVSPRALVGTLSLGKQQLVEIAKALSAQARVIIMDEPTSALSQHESEALFRVIRDLRQRGVSVIYISHRLREVKEIADRVVVLRDGRNAGELSRDEITHDNLVRLMVGRNFEIRRARVSTGDQTRATALEVRSLRTATHPHHELNFSLRPGEIVGVAGLVGAGRTEMLEVLFGIEHALGGEILMDGVAQNIESPRDAIRAGMALVPEDRKQQGVILEMAVSENLSLASLRREASAAFINHRGERSMADEMVAKLGIKTPNLRQFVQYLSGGNQQKVVIGKWLALRPRVLLLDEPTRGIDVGAKQEICKLMEQLAAEGVAILFVSSEMEEILRMSDRALVMHEGRISGELKREELSEDAVMGFATGARRT